MKFALIFLTIPLLAQQGVNFYNLEKEKALGQQMAAEVRKNAKPFDHPAASAYLNRVGSQIAAAVTESPFEYRFELISGVEQTEPMAIVGGQIFVPASTFLAVQNEAEFAGLLAHSIAHIALRHGTRSATRGQLTNMASVPLIYMAGWNGPHADSAAPQTLAPLSFLQLQRTFEMDADAYGLKLAARAGYPGGPYRSFIERNQSEEQNKMSPLPAREVRLAKMEEVLRELPAVQYLPSGEFEKIQASVRAAAN